MATTKLINFYKSVIKMCGLEVDNEGFIKTTMNDGSTKLVTVGTKPLVIPYKKQIDNMTVVEDGEVVIVKTLFNPLREDIVAGENESLRKLRKTISLMLSYKALIIGVGLLKLAMDKDASKKLPLNIAVFFGDLNKARNRNIKEVVDDKTIEIFMDLWSKAMEGPSTKNFANFFTRKGGVIDGTKYNRVASIAFPVYESLVEAQETKDDTVYGVKVRNKDKVVLAELFKFIFDIENATHTVGSNDDQSPAFISLFMLYSVIAERFNDITDAIEAAVELEGDSKVDIALSIDEIRNAPKTFSKELKLIPDGNVGLRKQNRIAEAIKDERSKQQVAKRVNVKDILKRISDDDVREQKQPQTEKREDKVEQEKELTALEKIIGRRSGTKPQQKQTRVSIRPLDMPFGNQMQQPMNPWQQPRQRVQPNVMIREL